MMTRITLELLCCAFIISHAAATTGSAGVIEFADKSEWEAAVGGFTTIGFNEYPNFTFITDQYADLGIHFTDGDDFIWHMPNAFPNDGFGLGDGYPNEITMEFDEPQAWLAIEFPGYKRLELYRDGQLFHSTPLYGGSAARFFLGVVSDQLFDKVMILPLPGGTADIDDLHFGVPAPGALALLALAVSLPARRRRR